MLGGRRIAAPTGWLCCEPLQMEYMRTGDDLSVSLPADSSPGRGAEGAGVWSVAFLAFCLMPDACCLMP